MHFYVYIYIPMLCVHVCIHVYTMYLCTYVSVDINMYVCVAHLHTFKKKQQHTVKSCWFQGIALCVCVCVLFFFVVFVFF